MTHVTVTGAAGFIGRRLVQRLLREGLHGKPVTRLTAVDLALDELPRDDPRLVPLPGSVADTPVQRAIGAEPVDVLFHLASLPGGAAERDPALGRRVNLDATLALLDALDRPSRPPRVVYASSIAVYGGSLPACVDEATLPSPALSYGAHKLACEILLADASRRGGVDGCALRLPGVVARPGDGAGLISAFMSQLFWKLAAGQPIALPVTREGTAWWISAEACVANLVHAAELPAAALKARRTFQMPALQLSLGEVIDALCRRHGADHAGLVSHDPQPMVQRLFASYPPLRTPAADAAGFRHDGSADALVENAFMPR
jgi:nucleoside-diphosphate-sugar epimerase